MLPFLLSLSCFRQPWFPYDFVAPPLLIRLGTTHSGCVALSTRIRFTLVLLNHDPVGCVEDPPVALARLLCCNLPHRGLISKHQRAVFRGPFCGSKHHSSTININEHLCQAFGCPPGLRPSPPVIVANITRLGNRPLLWRATAPAKSRRLRMALSMLSYRVFLSAFAYETVA